MDESAPMFLLAPDYGSLDTIWRHPLPYVLWPVGPKSLLAHWMDEAVRRNASKVVIYAPDRPAEIRKHLEGGGYWSKTVEVIPITQESAAPVEATRLEGLPSSPAYAPVGSPQELLQRWLELQEQWLQARHSQEITMDVEKVPGGWVGPGAMIHPTVELRAPFWIGARSIVGARCRIGPMAILHPGCLLDGKIEVERAIILPDTYLGQNTRLHEAAAQGGLLIDIKRAVRVEIEESFILGSRNLTQQKASWLGRLLALSAWISLAPLALLWPGQKWVTQSCFSGRETLPLSTGGQGPLLLRRWKWLRYIIEGKFRWFGPLPRSKEQAQMLPDDLAQRLAEHLPGVFSWADSHGCHDPGQDDEWIHTAFQLLHDDGSVNRLLLRQVWKLAFTTPTTAHV